MELTIQDCLNILSMSIVSGFLIAFIPWLLGMVVTLFKNIINKI